MTAGATPAPTNGAAALGRVTTLLLCLLGCATTGRERAGPAGGLEAIVDPPVRPGVPTLLIAMPGSPNFLEVRRSLVAEVQKTFNVRTLAVGPETTVTELASAVETLAPVCVVLMNNATMNLYHQYQVAHPTTPMPPAVLLMASFVEAEQGRLRRATGIAYEVPGVTAFVNLRAVVGIPVRRVGVVYRPAFRRFVERQTFLAAKESVELISVAVPSDVSAVGLRDALHGLAVDGKVDAIWMLNDNGLLRDGEFIEDAWRAELRDAKLPLIVGVPNLVEPSAPLATLAVVPDLEALGLQAANLLFDLQDDNWHVESHPVELPLSVKTVVDLRLARASFGLRPDALKHIDRPLE